MLADLVKVGKLPSVEQCIQVLFDAAIASWWGSQPSMTMRIGAYDGRKTGGCW
jgi:hypothetical protein